MLWGGGSDFVIHLSPPLPCPDPFHFSPLSIRKVLSGGVLRHVSLFSIHLEFISSFLILGSLISDPSKNAVLHGRLAGLVVKAWDS